MKDLKITVDRVVKRCGAHHKPGECFYIRGKGRIELPPGQTMCVYAISGLIPFLTAKQREDDLPNDDYIPETYELCCPDPEGIVFKIEAL